MAVYVLEVEGENLLVCLEGHTGKYGFYTHRLIETNETDQLKDRAIEMVRTDQRLHQLIQNSSDDPPTFRVTSIYELASRDDISASEGFIWYAMTRKRWWQFWRS